MDYVKQLLAMLADGGEENEAWELKLIKPEPELTEVNTGVQEEPQVKEERKSFFTRVVRMPWTIILS